MSISEWTDEEIHTTEHHSARPRKDSLTHTELRGQSQKHSANWKKPIGTKGNTLYDPVSRHSGKGEITGTKIIQRWEGTEDGEEVSLDSLGTKGLLRVMKTFPISTAIVVTWAYVTNLSPQKLWETKEYLIFEGPVQYTEAHKFIKQIWPEKYKALYKRKLVLKKVMQKIVLKIHFSILVSN